MNFIIVIDLIVVFKKKYLNKSLKNLIQTIMIYKEIKFCQYIFMEGWQSGQMQRTVTPSGKPYIGSNPIPSTIHIVNPYFFILTQNLMEFK